MDGLSTALRLLIHYTGDVHQPLHGTARVDHEYPQGDRGGNSFPLPTKDQVSNLHAAWDAVLYEFYDDFSLPFSDAGWQSIGDRAAALVKNHPLSTLGNTNDLNPHHWAQESFQVAEQFIYKSIHENQALPDTYVSTGM